MRPTILCIVCFGILLINGCSTVHNMSKDTGGSSLDLDGKGMLLMSVEFSNKFRPEKKAGVDQKIVFLIIETKDKSTGQITTHNFQPDERSVFVNNEYAKYAFRMLLPEGDYRLRLAGVDGGYGLGYGLMFIPNAVKAFAVLPFVLDTKVKSGEVDYIGNISAIIEERTKDDELRATIMPPYLVPQPVNLAAGFHIGTFKVQVIDKFDREVDWYKEKYPVLQSYNIGKAILPPYNYENAKEWAKEAGGNVTHSSYEKPVSDRNAGVVR
jgi:hypothetical protein